MCPQRTVARRDLHRALQRGLQVAPGERARRLPRRSNSVTTMPSGRPSRPGTASAHRRPAVPRPTARSKGQFVAPEALAAAEGEQAVAHGLRQGKQRGDDVLHGLLPPILLRGWSEGLAGGVAEKGPACASVISTASAAWPTAVYGSRRAGARQPAGAPRAPAPRCPPAPAEGPRQGQIGAVQGTAVPRTSSDHAAERRGERVSGSLPTIGLVGSPAQVTVRSCSLRNHIRKSGATATAAPPAPGGRGRERLQRRTDLATEEQLKAVRRAARQQALQPRSSGVGGHPPAVRISPSANSAAPLASIGCNTCSGCRNRARRQSPSLDVASTRRCSSRRTSTATCAWA